MEAVIKNLPVIISVITLLFVSFNIVATNYRAYKSINDDNVKQNTKVLYELTDIKGDTTEVRKDLGVIKIDNVRDRDRILSLEKDVEVIKQDVKDIKKYNKPK